MPRLRTTLGQLLVNEALPEDMRDYRRQLDKKGLSDLLRDVAERHPERYRDISFKLMRIGQRAAYVSGGKSFGLQALRKREAGRQLQQQLLAKIDQVLSDPNLTDEGRENAVVRLTGGIMDQLKDAVYEESLKEGNPLAIQLAGAGRGNKNNLAALRAGDLLYTDHRDRVIPVPVVSSYSEGLTPAEYWAGSYGARKGVVDVKMATADAGYLGKQLNQIAHRMVVSDLDDPTEPESPRGLPVDVEDRDNEGSLLAMAAGPYQRNTVLTPKILSDLRRRGHKRILVRSVVGTAGPSQGGVYARDVGYRERGLPMIGESVGNTAAQALAEPLSQAQLSSKHSGGVAGASANQAVSGFDYINQLMQVPKHFRGGAAHAELDGTVQAVREAPAGGMFVTIGGQEHYVPQGLPLKVKRGQTVEAGDVISEGIPNPATVAKHKGVGEGQRYFVQAMRQAFKDAGLKAHRRNVELLSAGLINHVRLTDEAGDGAPGDIVPYSTFARQYQPREGFRSIAPRQAVGKYLEKPVLHYSIGTKVRPSMLQDFSDFRVKSIDVHDDPPPFEPEMVRGAVSLTHDPDWMTRMYASHQQSSLLKAVQRGEKSDPFGSSFVPALAKGVDFGQQGLLTTPKPAKETP